jgi:hypothetical protein
MRALSTRSTQDQCGNDGPILAMMFYSILELLVADHRASQAPHVQSRRYCDSRNHAIYSSVRSTGTIAEVQNPIRAIAY